MNTLAKTGGALSSLLFKKLPDNSGLRLRFPAPYIERDRTLPPIAAKPFREQHPEIIPGKEGAPTVAFFTGCGINYMYPAIGDVFLRALQFLGVTIIIPQDQACCGLPAVSAGAAETVEQLAQQNLRALTRHPVDYVVTACASCNAGIGKIYADMGGDFKDLAAKTKDSYNFV